MFMYPWANDLHGVEGQAKSGNEAHLTIGIIPRFVL